MTLDIYKEAYTAGPVNSNRVMFIGDSLTMRAHISFTGLTVASVSGTDVTITHANGSPTIGDKARLYNQSDREVAYTDATVISNISKRSLFLNISI